MQCEMMAQMLREWRIVPTTATAFADVLRAYKETRPDLVLLDVMMPQIDGYKLAQVFKRDPSFIPVIMLTALDDLESKRRGLTAGADEFLTKPVNTIELQIRMSSMIRIKRLTDELENANKTLAALATFDPLTELANRRLLEQRLTSEFQRAERYQRPLTVIMVDIDHFKRVNDSHGHQIGDKVLGMVGEVLRQCTRSTDLAGRFGGEEFMIVAPETSIESARVLAERVRSLVVVRSADGDAQEQGIPPITVSVGVATTTAEMQTQDDLVKRADDALYAAKREGRDRIVIAE